MRQIEIYAPNELLCVQWKVYECNHYCQDGWSTYMGLIIFNYSIFTGGLIIKLILWILKIGSYSEN